MRMVQITAVVFLMLIIASGCLIRPMEELVYEDSGESQELRYVFQDPEGGYLSTLREDFGIMSRTSSATSDLQRLQILTEWVHGLWEHEAEHTAAKLDPLSILWEAEEASGFSGVESAVVLSGALQAIAIPTRYITLHGRDIEERTDAYVVVEAYLRDRQQWVMADPLMNRIPIYEDEPLSAYQLQQVMGSDPRKISYLQQRRDTRYSRMIRDHLYYMHTNQDSRVNTEVYAFKNLLLAPANLPIPRYMSPYHRHMEYELSDSASVTRDPSYFYGDPIILFDDEGE